MRDRETAQIGCETLCVAISEIAGDMEAFAAATPRDRAYRTHAAQLARLAADISALTIALAVMAQHPPLKKSAPRGAVLSEIEAVRQQADLMRPGSAGDSHCKGFGNSNGRSES